MPDQALEKAFNVCQLCVRENLLAELTTVLNRPRVTKYGSRAAFDALMDSLRRKTTLFPLSASDLADIHPSCRDAKDNHILALASVAKAAVIVTSDQDLLILNPWNGIPILSPSEFLAKTENSEPLESEHS